MADNPPSSPTPEDVDEVNDLRASGTEVEQSETSKMVDQGAKSAEGAVPGFRLLASLLKATLFTDLFFYHAVKQHLHPREEERIAALVEKNNRFYKLCRNADFCARLIIGGVLIFLVAYLVFGATTQLFWDGCAPWPSQCTCTQCSS